MTMLTPSALYSLCSPFAEAKIVVDVVGPIWMKNHPEFTLSTNGAYQSSPYGPCCPSIARTLSSQTGVDVIAWGGLDGAQEICSCEMQQFRRPLKWSLLAISQCRIEHCQSSPGRMPEAPPARAIADYCRRAEAVLAKVRLMNLVAFAEPEIHFSMGTSDRSGTAVYINPIRSQWEAVYVGRILPTTQGSRQRATGSHNIVSPVSLL